jgi:hypothetical protein
MKDDPGESHPFGCSPGAPTGDKPVGRVWVHWGARLGTSIRQGWQSFQSGSNEMVKRIAISYQRFTKGKQP